MEEDLIVTQELASTNGMYNTVTGEDLFDELKKIFDHYNLDWSHLHCLTIDGGRNMCGLKKGLVGQLKQSCAQNKISEPTLLHCIIHNKLCVLNTWT